jgi:S-DNA-T family DNA segregation ATPase FtsK/SpoIIIE
MAKRKKKTVNAHKRQAWGVLLLGISILLFIALGSFDVNDPVNLNMQRDGINVTNWLGPLGSVISYFMMQWTLGYPILALPVFLFLLALYAIQNKSYKDLIRPGWLLLGWAVLASIFLAMPGAFDKMGNMTEYYPSGLIGGWLASKLVIYLGKFGSLLSLILLSLVLFVITIRIELAQIITQFSSKANSFQRIITSKWNVIKLSIKEKIRQRKLKKKTLKKEQMIRREKSKAEDEGIPEITIDEQMLIKKSSQLDDIPEKEVETKKETETETVDQAEKPKMIQTTLDEIIAKMENPQEDSGMVKQAAPEKSDQAVLNGVEFEVEEEVQDIQLDYDQLVKESIARYKFPSIDLLAEPVDQDTKITRIELKSNADLLEMKLMDFGVKAKVVKVTAGPVITLYELQPAPGVKVSSIVSLANDLALAMEARGIRIIAPIPGKAAVGIEIPNRNPQIVYLKSIIRSERFTKYNYELPLGIGKTINGESYVTDLTKMPHLLIAGATGTGKSVGINTIIMSLLYSIDPGKVKFMMIDPKKLELSLYRDLRDHYLIWRPDLDEAVITKPNNAVSMLNSLVLEMERRYDQLAHLGARNIIDYNKKIEEGGAKVKQAKYQHLPYIVIIIDELADLMMVGAKEVEAPIARIAQMARAVGLHLIVATQRPSVNIITGMIKANFPARMAYQVATKVDSRTVLDMNGAEQLLGNGDVLFLPPGRPKPVRLQNSFIDTNEVERVIEHVRRQPKLPYYSVPQPAASKHNGGDFFADDSRDSMYEEARAIVIQHQQGSISLLQRRLKLGYARAARLMDQLEEDGIVGPPDSSKPREVLVTLQEFKEMQ